MASVNSNPASKHSLRPVFIAICRCCSVLVAMETLPVTPCPSTSTGSFHCSSKQEFSVCIFLPLLLLTSCPSSVFCPSPQHHTAVNKPFFLLGRKAHCMELHCDLVVDAELVRPLLSLMPGKQMIGIAARQETGRGVNRK